MPDTMIDNNHSTSAHATSAPCTLTPIKASLHQEDISSPCKTTASTPCSNNAQQSLTTADDWYLQGERVWYDPNDKQIVDEQKGSSSCFQIFQRVVLPEPTSSSNDVEPTTPQKWMTFLPSNPEGSFGFHLVEEALSLGSGHTTKPRSDTESTELSADLSVTETNNEDSSRREPLPARLYLDFTGQGDSDTVASSEDSSTKQRADLVEALWKAHGIERTVVVSAGDSSLVTMELLQRQRQRLAAGSPFPKILHVLALNGRYVAKTRHSSQLATVTQLLRSDRVGPSLAAKAQRSDFTLAQCLQPYLKGCRARQVRKQVALVVKRNEGAAALVEMARTVDDHLHDRHRYRWHLPHLLKVFTLDQGITFHLVTNTRSGQRQVQLVQQQLEDYDLENCPGVQYSHYAGRQHVATSSFLLDSSPTQLEPFLKDIQRLAAEQIPMSDNSMLLSSRFASFEEEDHPHDEGEDSWHPNEEEGDVEEEEPSLDTRLETEIVFDATDMHDDDDDFEFF